MQGGEDFHPFKCRGGFHLSAGGGAFFEVQGGHSLKCRGGGGGNIKLSNNVHIRAW